MKKNKTETHFTFSHSEISMFLDCQYAHFDKYIMGNWPEKTKAVLKFGGYFHNCLAQMLLKKRDGIKNEFDDIHQLWQTQWDKLDRNTLFEEETPIEEHIEKGIKGLRYFYNTRLEHLNPLEIEKDGTFKLDDKFSLYGIVDYMDKGNEKTKGNKFLIDWKTCSRLPSGLSLKDKIQVVGYLLSRGINIGGLMYLSKTKKPGHKDFFFNYPDLDSLTGRYLSIVLPILMDILDTYQGNRAPLANGIYNITYGSSKCDFCGVENCQYKL